MATPGPALTPGRAAILLSHWLDAAEQVGIKRFPVDIPWLAKEVGPQLKRQDRIEEVVAADIKTFEGGLFRLDSQRWALVYNQTITSAGRIRFTQAHELGHYLLHASARDVFECSQEDVLRLKPDEKEVELQADEFASQLLMPLSHFRPMTSQGAIDLEKLSNATVHFGVSLTAASLRWIRSTEESAVLVLSRDGFIDWSISSQRAFDNGVFIRTRQGVVEVPADSVAADVKVSASKGGERLPLKTWFKHAHVDAVVREMKITCDNYGYILSLLHLSPADKAWPPGKWAD